MYYFPKRHFFNAPFPPNGSRNIRHSRARAQPVPSLPVNLQPVNLEKAYIPKLPQHPAAWQSHAVRAAALMPAHAYRALVFEYVARAQFPKP